MWIAAAMQKCVFGWVSLQLISVIFCNCWSKIESCWFYFLSLSVFLRCDCLPCAHEDRFASPIFNQWSGSCVYIYRQLFFYRFFDRLVLLIVKWSTHFRIQFFPLVFIYLFLMFEDPDCFTCSSIKFVCSFACLPAHDLTSYFWIKDLDFWTFIQHLGPPPLLLLLPAF